MILFPTDIIVHKERGVKFDIYCSYLLFHLPGSHPLRDQIVSYTFRKNENNEWIVTNELRPWFRIDTNKCTEKEIGMIKSVQKHAISSGRARAPGTAYQNREDALSSVGLY